MSDEQIRIIHGDCVAEMQQLIKDGVRVDMIVTDPPYKMTSRGHAGNTGGMMKKDSVRDGRVFTHNDCHISKWAKLCFDILNDGSHAYFMTNNINLTEYLNELQKVGFHFVKCLVWDKKRKIMGPLYMGQFEYIIFCRKGAFKKVNNCGIGDILSIANVKTKGRDGKNLHDTEKPVALMDILVNQSTNEGDLVLDPFMGIGSLAISCKKNNRRCIGIELDETYFQIAKDRIEKNITMPYDAIKG